MTLWDAVVIVAVAITLIVLAAVENGMSKASLEVHLSTPQTTQTPTPAQ